MLPHLHHSMKLCPNVGIGQQVHQASLSHSETDLTEQLVLITNQYATVFYYWKAYQGGMCQLVGPACYHYIDPSGLMQVKHDLEQARKLKEEFRKANWKDAWDLQCLSWLSWLNPANWFNALEGWIVGMQHITWQVLICAVIIYTMIKLILC